MIEIDNNPSNREFKVGKDLKRAMIQLKRLGRDVSSEVNKHTKDSNKLPKLNLKDKVKLIKFK